MKLIKVASLEDKLKRAGEPTNPLLVQVCRLDDTKNLLNWNNIRTWQDDKQTLEKELENFFDSGKALKAVKTQIGQTKKSCNELMLFENDKPRKHEISTQDRKRISGYLEHADNWEKCLFDDKKFEYKKSKAFLYTMIASDSISNYKLMPSYELLEQIYTEFSKDTSKEQVEEITNDEELVAKLKNVGINDLSGDISDLTSDIQKSLVVCRDDIEKKKVELEWMVGFDPTVHDSLPIDEEKEKYKGMDFEKVKEMIYKENSKIPEHAREKALEGILKATKRYLWATPIDELGEEERARFEELKSSLSELKAKRDDLNPILEDILYNRSKGENQIAELCESVQVQNEVDAEIETDFTKNIKDGWYLIPGGDNKLKAVQHKGIDLRDRFPDTDWKNFGNRIQFVSLVSAGTGWCINQLSYAKGYTREGDNLLYVENKIGKVCIRYSSGKISEFTGFNNRPIKLVPYADEIFSLCEDYPKIGENLKTFKPGKNHGSLEGIRKDIVGVEEHNKLTPKELAAKIEADVVNPEYNWRVDFEEMNEWQRRTTSDYIYDDKVIECASCPEFVAAIKKQWMKMENNEKEGLAGRFPFLKKDDEVIDRAIEVVKAELKQMVNYGNDNAMRGVSLINMCNQFGQIPLKDPEVRELAFKAYSKMVGEKNPDEKKKNILTHLRVIVKEAGAYPLFQDVAASEGLMAISEGDLEKFSKIKEDFDLSGNLDDLKEGALEGLIDKATLLYLDDLEEFERLDKLFGGKFTQTGNFDRILAGAYKEGIERAKRGIEISGGIEISDEEVLNAKLVSLFELFPELQKEPSVVAKAIKKSSKLIITDNDAFIALDKVFENALSSEENFQKIREMSRPFAIDKVGRMINECQIGYGKLEYILSTFPDLKKEARVVNEVLKLAEKLIIDSPVKFNELDELFDNVLTKGDYYEYIVQKSKPHAVGKAKNALKNNNIPAFKALIERFPFIQHDLEVVNSISTQVIDLLANGNIKEAQVLYKAMGFTSHDLDWIYDEVFDKISDEAKRYMSQWDMQGLAKLDRLTGRKVKKNKEGDLEVSKRGKVMGDRSAEIIEGSKEMALTFIVSRLLFWPLESSEKDPIGKLKAMDHAYGGTFITNPKVKEKCKILYIKCKGFENEELYGKISKGIEGIYGKNLVTNQDLARFRKKQLKNIAIKSEEVLNLEDFEKLKVYFSNFPELKEDRGLLKRSIMHVYNCGDTAWTDSFERLNVKKVNAETLNSLFEGKVLNSPMGAQGYGNIKKALNKASMSNITSNPQVSQKPTYNSKDHQKEMINPNMMGPPTNEETPNPEEG